MMKKEWKGALIGGVVGGLIGIILFFLFNGFCLEKSFRLKGQEQYPVLNCFGSPSGGGCCPVTFDVLFIHLIVLIGIPITVGAIIYSIIKRKIKK